MLVGQGLSARVSQELKSAISEIFETISRRFILIIGVLYLVWHVFAAVSWSGPLAARTYAITAVFLAAGCASLYLLKVNFLAAQIVWELGLALSIAMGAVFYQEPMLLLLLVFLPLLAVISVDLYFGIAMEALATGLVAALVQSGLVADL